MYRVYVYGFGNRVYVYGVGIWFRYMV